MTHALLIKNLSVRYGDNEILKNVSCYVPACTIAAIIGPNGAGKSTLIKSILGLIQPTSGSIFLLGLSLDHVRKKIAYIPQRAYIDWDFPATVYDVIRMGRYPYIPWFSSLSDSDYGIVDKALHIVGLEQYRDTPISKLSGGQQQLTLLARAFAMQADLYLLDEPFTGVDTPTEKKIIILLKQLCKNGKTVIIVHHDWYTLSTYFDWIICLNQFVIAQGTTQEILNAQDVILKTYKRTE